MFKKTLLASAVLAASTGVALANGGSYTPPKPQSAYNVYVGAGVSRDAFNYEEPIAKGYKDDKGGKGWNGDLFAGVGYTFQHRYYIAGEIFGSLSNAKLAYYDKNAAGKFYKEELQAKHSYGISLIPGVKLSDSTMMYGRVGLNQTKFECKEKGTSESKNKSGLQLGLGVQTMVANNVSLRMEYDWNHFGDIKAKGIKADNLTTNQVKLQVAYHFKNLI